MKFNENLKNIFIEAGLIRDSSDTVDFTNTDALQKAMDLINDDYEKYDLKEEFVHRQMAKLGAVVEASPCTISWINEDIKYIAVNKMLADICQIPMDEFPGKDVGFYTNNSFFNQFAKEIFASEETILNREIHANIEGEEKSFWIAASKYNQNREAVIVGIETTELKNLQNHLNFNEKLSSLGQMAAGIVHEINSPLQLISLSNKKLRKYFESTADADPKLIDRVQKIDDTVLKITKIIKGLKNFARKGDDDPLQEYSVTDIIDEAIQICGEKFKKNNIDLILEVEDNLLADINVTQLSQVFVNLLNNAVDAIEEFDNRWISIKARDVGEFIEAIVTDCGNGIPLKVQEKIFQPFFTTKGIGKGTGLGVGICHKIVTEKHNGKFYIDNDAKNTTFVVHLPKKQALAA